MESIIETTTAPKDIVPEEEGLLTITCEKEPENDIVPEVVKESAKIAGFIPNLDVCFMLDVTGSMQSHVDRAKNKIKEIIEEVKQQYPESEIKVGIVAYRDVQDTPRFDILQFTSNIQEARDFLNRIRTSGGGDTPEDVNGAFQKVLAMEWQGQAKMIVHIADAPCHGRDFHNADDNHPNGHKDDVAWDQIFKEIVNQHMDYLLLKINYQTDKMFDKFKEIAEAHGAAANGVLFKQEPISNAAEQNARPSLFIPYVPMPTIAAKKESAAIREIRKETVKTPKTRKPRESKSVSKKSAPSKTPSRKKTAKKAAKDKDDDEEGEESKWDEPTYWTRSRAREFDESKPSTRRKKEAVISVVEGSNYWVIPVREETATSKRTSVTRKTRTRKSSVSKEKERDDARGKSKSRTRKGKGKSKSKKSKEAMDSETMTSKRAFVAPEGKSYAKPMAIAFPPGMSAMDEQAYFAELMSRELKDSISRKLNV